MSGQTKMQKLEKTTLLIVFALVLTVCSIHLPWIYDECEGILPIKRQENWFWSFMERSIFYYEAGSYPPQLGYELFDELWGSHPILEALGMGRPLSNLYEGYYIIFVFQLLTVLFLGMCIGMERWDNHSLQLIIYIITFVISIGAPIVGVNQYVRDWSFVRRVFVQFEIGFYLAVVSSILTLMYVLSFTIKIFRE